MKQNQSGFTLIEIAIVLVIIGLLLGGVMKGQELINSAKVKNLATDFKNIPVFIYGYQDKYRALPGDDKDVKTHISASAVAAASSTVGTGTIDGVWNETGEVESHLFWQHVRMAGLAAGPTDVTADIHPSNATGGIIGVSSAANSPIKNLTGSYIICSSAIAGKFAKQLDITMDDGKSDTGSMRTRSATSPGTATDAETTLTDDTPYIVCMGF